MLDLEGDKLLEVVVVERVGLAEGAARVELGAEAEAVDQLQGVPCLVMVEGAASFFLGAAQAAQRCFLSMMKS